MKKKEEKGIEKLTSKNFLSLPKPCPNSTAARVVETSFDEPGSPQTLSPVLRPASGTLDARDGGSRKKPVLSESFAFFPDFDIKHFCKDREWQICPKRME